MVQAVEQFRLSYCRLLDLNIVLSFSHDQEWRVCHLRYRQAIARLLRRKNETVAKAARQCRRAPTEFDPMKTFAIVLHMQMCTNFGLFMY